MKPINIKISAFGPYKDEVFIDFTKFYDNGIFLISGETGSGKTTIFDAICFALFGVASGSIRTKNSFRSDFALDEVKTNVILEFSHKNIIYRVERNPSYMRKKKRGEGYTQVSGDASLTYLDKVITGDKNVTDKCVEILGINAIQFKQISMIAQGEFLKLLLAKPNERADIFRKIFDTYIYRDISDRLKKKYLNLKREYEDVNISIDNFKDSIIFDESVEIDNYNVLDFLELVSKEICKDENLESKLGEKKTKILNKIQKVTSDIDNAILINDSFLKYETNNKILELKFRNEDIIERRRLLINKNKEIINNIVPFYNEVLRIDNLIKDKTIEIDKNKVSYKKINKKYALAFEKYNLISLERNKLDNLKLNLNDLENKLPLFIEITSLKKELLEKMNIYSLLELRKLNELLEKLEYNEKLKNKYTCEEDKFIRIKNDYDELSFQFSLKYDKFISCQAGIIASGLKDNTPCPVCGSLTHPCKAILDSDYITKEEIDSFKDILNKKQKELEEVSNYISSLNKEIEVSNNDIKDIDRDEVDKKIKVCESNIIDRIDVSKYDIDEVFKDISYIEASIDNKESLIKDGETEELINEKIKNINLEICKINEFIVDITSEYEKLSKDRTSMEASIKVIDEEIIKLKEVRVIKYNEYVESYKKCGYELESDYLDVKLDSDLFSKYEKEVNNYDIEISGLKSKIRVLEEVICGKEKVDISSLEKIKEEKNVELSDVELSLKNIHSRLNNNKIVYNKLKNVYKKNQKLEEELVLYEDLSNTANGNIKGKNKLEFEQYVQASYFDNVLVSANKRFGYMTDSRYLLVRKMEASKISDKLGLELEVFDNYTGKNREITSLSGGESFKASLSLALGISDVIQSYSGGIVVETMFIDEGFGSLDSDSLEVALDSILMLSSNDKLIGIISHVNELKDRIDKKIIVNKSNSGSSVRVVV